MDYQSANYLMGAAKVTQLPEDSGIEVAFAGRSNAGKSSALNALTQRKNLARISKTPGRTQLINFFSLTDNCRLVDLPGYGYAKVSKELKRDWQQTLSDYLRTRASLHGLVLLMDSRHPLKEFDVAMLDWCIQYQLPCHILLSKVDKLNNQQRQQALRQVKQAYSSSLISVQAFSALKKLGITELKNQLDEWFVDKA